MARKLDEIVVIDVEATCWEGGPPPGQLQEIIEIGVCPLVVATGVRGARESLLVRPTSSTVSAYCTALTTLTAEDLAGGLGFAEACAALADRHDTRERAWASWGDFDRNIFERQCKREGVKTPFGPTHLNVKHLFAVARALPGEVGMAEALAMAGLPLEGTHHRGADDAWNIAALLAALLAGMRRAPTSPPVPSDPLSPVRRGQG
jgi:inhibitor of KinA sporulation pathway (predicted exonuclease)